MHPTNLRSDNLSSNWKNWTIYNTFMHIAFVYYVVFNHHNCFHFWCDNNYLHRHFLERHRHRTCCWQGQDQGPSTCPEIRLLQRCHLHLQCAQSVIPSFQFCKRLHIPMTIKNISGDIQQKKSKLVYDGTLFLIILLCCGYLSTMASCHSLSDTSFGFVMMVVEAPRLNLKTTLPSIISRAMKSF